MIFNENVWVCGSISDDAELRLLPQFFRADIDMVWRLGGPLYQKFINACPLIPGFRYASIDSRVHMLMPGWYPCIPGWHCDDFYRPNGQPDLEDLPRMHHFAAVIGDTAFTEFIRKPIELPSPTEIYEACDSRRALYAYYNDMIEGTHPILTVRQEVSSGDIVAFTGRDFHRGTPATGHGWRLFVRLTQSDHYESLNQLRTQTQVYLPAPFEGW